MGAVVERGRPPKKERLVVIQSLVPVAVRQSLKRMAAQEHTTVSQLVRTILESFKGEY